MKADHHRKARSTMVEHFRKSESLLTDVRKFSMVVKEKSDKSSSGASLLDFKSYETIVQFSDSVLELCKKVMDDSNESKEMVERILQQRALIEKKRPTKTESKADSSFPLTAIDDDVSLRPRPECLLVDSDEEDDGMGVESDQSGASVEDENDDSENENGEKAAKLASRNAAKKLAPMHEDEGERNNYRINRLKKRVLRSSLISDLRKQYSDAPEEIRENQEFFDESFERNQKMQQKYEEDYSVRLSENKRQKHYKNRKMERSGMDSLLSFGQYLMPGDDENENDNDSAPRGKEGGRKRKGGFRDGPTPSKFRKNFSKKKGGKKKRFT